MSEPREDRKCTTVGVTACAFALLLGGCVTGPVATQSAPDGPAVYADLIRVWGFLKYHHPDVRAGCYDWDAEFLRMVGAIDSTETRSGSDDVFGSWIDSLEVAPVDCVRNERDTVAETYDSTWLGRLRTIDEQLAQRLRQWLPAGPASQHYVSLAQGVNNPKFDNEREYPVDVIDDPGYRLLALARYWNAIEYWFPYRYLIDEDWHAVLDDSVQDFIDATDAEHYELALMRLIARVDDGHARLFSAWRNWPPGGELIVDAQLRLVEGRPFVWRVGAAGAANGLRYGDIVISVDGEPIDDRLARMMPYHGGSNATARRSHLLRHVLRGTAEQVTVTVERTDETATLTLDRVPMDLNAGVTHDRDGPELQTLGHGVVYLKLSAIEAERVPDYIEAFRNARAVVIDIRNYPSAFVVRDIGRHLVSEAREFVRFKSGDLKRPGSFVWGAAIPMVPLPPFIDAPVAVLVDEVSLSQAEYTAMAFRVGDNVTIVGSQTAGADGNISRIDLPGGHRTLFSGIGVYYPDKTPTQQVGIVPDVNVKPTVDGLRAGRDEVLETAIRQLMGDALSEDAVRELARIPPATTPVSE